MTTKEKVEENTLHLLEEVMSYAKNKIKRALVCGAVDVSQYGDNYELPKIILHAVMKTMVDETRPLGEANRKESNNLYKFL